LYVLELLQRSSDKEEKELTEDRLLTTKATRIANSRALTRAGATQTPGFRSADTLSLWRPPLHHHFLPLRSGPLACTCPVVTHQLTNRAAKCWKYERGAPRATAYTRQAQRAR
jgi:hypothetical protein